jgi:hypothetical protein
LQQTIVIPFHSRKPIMYGAQRLSAEPAYLMRSSHSPLVPKRAPLCHQWVFAGDAVHKYIEAATLAFHSLEEGLDLFFHCVIDAQCDGGAAGRADQFGCLINRFRTIVRGAVGTHASSRAIDRRTSFSERPSDAATCAACRAGNDSDGAGK